MKRRFKNSLTTGLAYGAGLVLGNIVAQLLFRSVSLNDPPIIADDSLRFVLGLFLVFAIAMFGGGIGGFIGGWTLPTVGRPRGRWGYSWHGALSLGIPYGTVLYLLVFLIYTLVVGDLVDISPRMYAIAFSLLGGMLGLVAGLALGISTVGRRFLRVALAGLVGFAIGGVGLGLGFWAFFGSLPPGELAGKGAYPFLLLGLFAFGLCGGTAFGYAYDSLGHSPSREERKAPTRRAKIIRAVLVVAILLFIGWKFWPLLVDFEHVFVPSSANLSQFLDADAVGTHWSYQTDLPLHQNSNVKEPALATRGKDRVALAWTEGPGEATAVYYVSGAWAGENGEALWGTPTVVSAPGARRPTHPQIAFDPSGIAHLLWLEEASGGERKVLYARCERATCSDPTVVSDQVGAACEAVVAGAEPGSADAAATAGAMAVSGQGTVLAVWGDSHGGLEYAAWPTTEPKTAPDRALSWVKPSSIYTTTSSRIRPNIHGG